MFDKQLFEAQRAKVVGLILTNFMFFLIYGKELRIHPFLKLRIEPITPSLNKSFTPFRILLLVHIARKSGWFREGAWEILDNKMDPKFHLI